MSNPVYNWLFAKQSLRSYACCDQDYDVLAIKTKWNEELKKYETVDRFDNPVTGFQEFVIEQRKYFKKFCKIMSQDGSSPWVFTNSNNYAVLPTTQFPGGKLAPGSTVPLPCDYQPINDWSGQKGQTRRIQLSTANRYFKDYNGDSNTWPTTTLRARFKLPEILSKKFIARQITSNNKRVYEPILIETYDYEATYSGANHTAHISWGLGFLRAKRTSSEFVIEIENTTGFEIVDKTFDPTLCTLTSNAGSGGITILNMEVDRNRILIKIGSSFSGAIGNMCYLTYSTPIITSKVFQPPKFDQQTYVINDGSEPYYCLYQTGSTSGALPGISLNGKVALALTTDGEKYNILASFLAYSSSCSIFQTLPTKVFTSTNTLPEKIEVELYRSPWSALAEIDLENTRFIEANYDGEKWSIINKVNWYDDLWMSYFVLDLSSSNNHNKPIIGGDLCIHDRIRVVVDGEFNESNRILKKSIYDRDKNKIDAIYSTSSVIIDKQYKSYSFESLISGEAGIINTKIGQFQGWDYHFAAELFKVVSGGHKRQALTGLNEGQIVTPDAGYLYPNPLWPNTGYDKVPYTKHTDINGIVWTIDANGEPAYIDSLVPITHGSRAYVNTNDLLDHRLTVGSVLNDGQTIFTECTIINKYDMYSNIKQSPKVEFYVSDISDDWIKATNYKKSYEVEIRYTIYWYAASPSSERWQVYGVERISASPNTLTTWTPSVTYGVEGALVSIETPRVYMQNDSAEPLKNNYDIRMSPTTHYVYKDFNSGSGVYRHTYIGARYSFANSLIKSSFGKIHQSGASTFFCKCNFLETLKKKPLVYNTVTSSSTIKNQNINSIEATDSNIVGWANKYGDSLQFRSELMKIGGTSLNQNSNLATFNVSNGVLTYQSNNQLGFIDVVYLNNDRKVPLTAVIFNLPNTLIYKNNTDATWQSLRTRTIIQGYSGGSYSGYTIPYFISHTYTAGSNSLTISSGSTVADYSWTFKVIRPTIDDSNPRKLIIDVDNLDQYVEVFISTSNYEYFDQPFENKIQAVRNQQNKFEVEIPYTAGTKYRIYIWDYLMSASLRSIEYVSIGPDPLTGFAGYSTPPSSPPTNGGIVNV